MHVLRNTATGTAFVALVATVLISVANGSFDFHQWSEFSRMTYAFSVAGTAFACAMLSYLNGE